MQDSYAQFDINADLTTAAFGAGVVGSYPSLKSYDTFAAGVPAAAVSWGSAGGGTIGGPLLHDFGRGLRLKFEVQITLAVTSAGAALVEADFVSDSNQNLATALTVLLRSAAIGKAALVQGYRFAHSYTAGKVPQQFIGAQYVISGATVTQGKITSGLNLDTDDHADVFGA